MKKRKANVRKVQRRNNQNLPLIIVVMALVLILPVTIIATRSRQDLSSLAVSGQTCKGMYIPADFGPGASMDKAIAAGNAVSVLRVNANSGPGTTTDSALASSIARARAAGIRIMGYVATNFGNRDPNTVKAEIDTWKRLYNVTDIMLDETWEQNTSKVAYYTDITAYIHKTPGAIDKINAGAVIPEAYMQSADIVGIFEGPYSQFTNFQVPAWIHNYPATRFSGEVHSVPNSSVITNALSIFQKNNIAYIMLTDSTNPWTQFSTDPFWTAFVAAVKANCNSSGNPQPSNQPTMPAPSSIVPTFVCAGSQNGICATPTTTPPTSSFPTQPQQPTQPPISQPATSQSPIISIAQPSIVQPTSTDSDNHDKNNNSFTAIIKILLQLIEQLLNLLKKLL